MIITANVALNINDLTTTTGKGSNTVEAPLSLSAGQTIDLQTIWDQYDIRESAELQTAINNGNVTAITNYNSVLSREVYGVAPFLYHLGGQFLLDPNEMNGWGQLGPIDNTNALDLGNVGAANTNRNAGGLVFPFDIKINRLYAWHKDSNNSAEPWGWIMFAQQKNAGSNTVTTTYILDEVADNGGTGPRDYNNNNQLTDLSFTTGNILPAGEVLVLGVAAPTAVGTNYYVQIQSGFLELERI